ncbi:unnamed protein product [Rotaria sordida]|uniref:Cyclin-dependent kinase 2-associated protein n=1 Tax=Rotaria sordida TaxID=392033 RepID=A0A815GDH2_9BILA|nr:unnamed protein product [Rotaria sordida]CAF1397212.1 unnamed protein product [Rotaria sordida]CAF1464682.1 unnamed protein product [Rotaria sordida]CAF3819235.1 unnamed protein product [Rotaria sordida]CAF3848965.1 unnamed protein product [Rotaria sordida]
MDLTMDLSIRRLQQSLAPLSRPILNPEAPTNMLQDSADRNSSHLSPPTVTMPSHNSIHQQQQSHQYVHVPSTVQQQLNQIQEHQQCVVHRSKYVQLLNVIEEMGKDIKPTYAGNKNSAERLRRAIASARVLVCECQLECD